MEDQQTAEQSELLRRIAEQDKQALAEFYDRMAGVLFSTAVRILGDAHEAEEVIQEVFVLIWDNAQTFDAVLGSPFNWAIGITRNRSIDRLRARQRRVRLLDELQNATAANPPLQTTSADIGFSAEELAGVRAAVVSLPRKQRDAIEMAFFGGMTHQEIAASLNEPLGTIKARIRRGMLKLRETLQPYL